MRLAPPGLEKRYRRFLNCRGDIVNPLVSILRGYRDERAGSRAWAALILSRVFILKGRLDLAGSYLRISSAIFRSLGIDDYPLGLWVNRAIILNAQGRISRAEGLLRRVFSLALRYDQVLAAAKAASNLAAFLARGSCLDDSASFLAFAEKSYKALSRRDELVRIELTKALLESRRGEIERAVDRIYASLVRCGEESLEWEGVGGRLLLAELCIRSGDYAKAGAVFEQLESRGEILGRFRPLNLRLMYLKHLFLRESGDFEGAALALEGAELLRESLGFGSFGSGAAGFECGVYATLPSDSGSHENSAEPNGAYGARQFGKAEGIAGSRRRAAGLFSMRSGSVSKVEWIDWGGAGQGFLTQDPRLIAMLDQVRRAARLPLPILLEGESGVGKDVVSRLIHSWSGRGNAPFVSINVAALPGGLFESALFGHSRGAFTGAVARHSGLLESAGNGTVFLDEIGELDTALQVKLLRFLDGGEYITLGGSAVKKSRARIVAATNRDLESAVGSGGFRKDLYYRLSVLSFRIPPLRERGGDIPLLAEHFLERACKLYDLGPMRMGESAAELLLRYKWPGNVRELQNEIIGAAVKKRKGTLCIPHFSLNIMRCVGSTGKSKGRALPEKIKELEMFEITRALQDSGGSCTRAAAVLGIKRTTLIYKMRRLGIE